MSETVHQPGINLLPARAEPKALSPRLRRERILRLLTGYFFVTPCLLYLMLFCLYPLVDTIRMSVSDVKAGEWYFTGLSNYETVLTDPLFWNSVRADIIFTIGSTVFHLLIGMVIALLLNEVWFSLGLRNFMRGLLILPWVFSSAASALMWSLLFHPYGLLNNMLVTLHLAKPIEFLAAPGWAMASVTAVNTWKAYPIYMIFILGALQAIPLELYEAAKVDGANVWERFRHVTLPQLRQILIISSTLDVIGTIGFVDLFKMLTKGGPLRTTESAPYFIYKRALEDGNLGYGAAMSVLMLIFLAFFTIFYVRTLSRGGEADGAGF